MHGSVFCVRGSRLLLPRVIAAAACAGILLFVIPLPSRADTRVAVIAAPGAGVEKLAPLVELRLGQRQGVTLLEREHIEEILREQELSALTAAEGTAKRVALGKLLKADLLIVMQAEKAEAPPAKGEGEANGTLDPPQPHVGVVICETHQGLRLCNQPVEVSKDVEKDADAVLQLAERAIAKQQKPIADIVAVPPFVNNTLVYEGDHLKAGCAKLVEELLLDRPGVLVVELAEAKAVAQELAIGGGGTVERRLPLYLLGEYRLEGLPGKRTVSFSLALQRGSSSLEARSGTAASVEEFPGRVRVLAGELFSKTLGQDVKPPDAKAEAEQLARRAHQLARLGNKDEALALTEAALLLDPQRYDLHGQAIVLLSYGFARARLAEFRESEGKPGPDRPSHRLAKALLPTVLHHLEPYLMHSQLERHTGVLWLPGHFWNRVESARNREDYQRCLQQNKAEMESVGALCRRVLDAKAAAKVQDRSLERLYPYLEPPIPDPGYDPNVWRDPYLREHVAEICDGRLKLLQQFSYLRSRDIWLSILSLRGTDPHWLCNDPAYLAFLNKAEALPNPGIKLCVKSLRRQLQREEAGRKALEDDRAGRVARPQSPVFVPPPESEREVLFHPIPLQVKGGGEVPRGLRACEPLGEASDLFINPEGVYVMERKDELRRLPIAWRRVESGGGRRRPANVCFDGRFVWVASPDPGPPPLGHAPPNSRRPRPADESPRFLAAIDPQSGRVWKLTADDGLLPMRQERGAAVAPFGPGRVCVAGFFGRTWCATATLDPQKGIALKVFFEAREHGLTREFAAAARSGPASASISYLHAASRPGGPGQPAVERVLLGSMDGARVVDATTGNVVKSIPRTIHADSLTAGKDAVFWTEGPAPPFDVIRHPLCRASFPDYARQVIGLVPNCDSWVQYEGRIVVYAAGGVWTAPAPDKEFRQLRGGLTGRGEGGRYGPDGTLAVSRHYGLMLLTGQTAYRMEFVK